MSCGETGSAWFPHVYLPILAWSRWINATVIRRRVNTITECDCTMGFAFLHFNREGRSRIREEPRVLRTLSINPRCRNASIASYLWYLVQLHDYRVRITLEPPLEFHKFRSALRDHADQVPKARFEFPSCRRDSLLILTVKRVLHCSVLGISFQFLHLRVRVYVHIKIRSDRRKQTRHTLIPRSLRIRIHTRSNDDPSHVDLREIKWHVLGSRCRFPNLGSIRSEYNRRSERPREVLLRCRTKHSVLGSVKHSCNSYSFRDCS